MVVMDSDGEEGRSVMSDSPNLNSESTNPPDEVQEDVQEKRQAAAQGGAVAYGLGGVKPSDVGNAVSGSDVGGGISRAR
jgi:hypothetical protein